MKTVHLVILCALPALLSAQAAKKPLPTDVDSKSYSRLPPIPKDSLDAEGKRNFEAVNGKEATTPRIGPANNIMYSPAVAEPYNKINQLLRKTVVGPQFFEICALIGAGDFNQQYEWTAHEVAARRANVDPKVIDAIKFDRPVAGLPDKEATVIEFGRALLRGNHQVSPAMYAKVVELFGRQGMMEMTMIMGDYVMTAMVLNAVDQHLTPDREPLLPQK